MFRGLEISSGVGRICFFLFGGISDARFVRAFLSLVTTLSHGGGYIRDRRR